MAGTAQRPVTSKAISDAWPLALLLLATTTACGGESPKPAPRTPSALPGSGGADPPPAVASEAAAGATSWPLGPAPSESELKAQAERLAKDPGPIKSNYTPPGKSDRYGHAEGLIAAPYDAVRARLLDFPRYKEAAGPKFKTVSVVDKSAAGTDLYFKLPVMKGLITLWYVARFGAPRRGMAGAEVIEGRFVKGNIKDMQIVFTIRPALEQKTILVCDLDLAINVPAPQSALDEELRDACGDAVNAVRARTAPPPP